MFFPPPHIPLIPCEYCLTVKVFLPVLDPVRWLAGMLFWPPRSGPRTLRAGRIKQGCLHVPVPRPGHFQLCQGPDRGLFFEDTALQVHGEETTCPGQGRSPFEDSQWRDRSSLIFDMPSKPGNGNSFPLAGPFRRMRPVQHSAAYPPLRRSALRRDEKNNRTSTQVCQKIRYINLTA